MRVARSCHGTVESTASVARGCPHCKALYGAGSRWDEEPVTSTGSACWLAGPLPGLGQLHRSAPPLLRRRANQAAPAAIHH